MSKLKGFKHAVLDFLEIFAISLLVFALVYVFIGQLMEVDGNSMYPTYLNQEKIVTEKVSMKFKQIKRGEVIIFQHPQIKERHLLIKRAVGLPGEIFKISGGSVYINGNKLIEPYLESGVLTKEIEYGVIQEDVDYPIPEHTYVLLGDNRGQSTDSRYFGAVLKDNIIGRAFLVYYPIQRFRLVEQR